MHAPNFFELRQEKCGNYRIASFTSEEMEKARQMKLLSQLDLLSVNQEEAIAFTGEDLGDCSQQQFLDASYKTASALNPTMKMVVSARGGGSTCAGIWQLVAP